ncbi:hypothetical protein [Devosia sp. LjRoot16]|uniref:hypothetical protein n=1 Tax=Devosia sp. LjRoot16 TaxID=3342271 RepID=UPI003F502EB6
MSHDDRIAEIIAGGERNAEAMKLMHNWCAHARAKRMGGVGMVEEMTKLPIGNFSVECDHAPTGSIAAYDFGESVLDFYDRNCAGCTVRQPVGLPNLSTLVAQRDAARKQAEAHAKADRLVAEHALATRSKARMALRNDLDPVNQALIDDFDAYDRAHQEVDYRRLVEAAKMAPERFDSRVVDLLFNQATEATLIAMLALEVGWAVAPTEQRLLLLAEQLFRRGIANDSAPRVLIANLSKLAEARIVALVPSAAELASPEHTPLSHGSQVRADRSLLIALWDAAPDAVRQGIEQLLDRHTTAASQLVGRTLCVILDRDPSSARNFLRSAAGRYVRATQILPDLDEYHDLGEVASALDLMMDLEPEELDRVLQGLSLGATIEATRNIAKLYGLMWRSRTDREGRSEFPQSRFRIGLERLVSLPLQAFDHEVLQTVSGAFRYPPAEAWPLIADRADRLVGEALLIDEKLAVFEASRSDKAPFLQQLEWQNLRQATFNVAECFLKAAAKASRSEPARSRFLDAVRAIPEDRALLRAIACRVAMELASDVDGLRAVLPILYSALVGASVYGRAEAATGLSELPAYGRQNLPSLVHEAFCVLLMDQYVMVHKHAVSSLSRISLPEAFRFRAAYALYNLVKVYSDEKSDSAFLVDCVDALARFASDLPEPDNIRDFCCQAVLKAEPVFVRSHTRSLRHSLSASDDFALVAAHVLLEYRGDFNGRDDEARLVRSITPRSARKHCTQLVQVAKELAPDDMWLSTQVVDVLYCAGLASEADVLLDYMAQIYRSTVKDERRALFVSYPLVAYRMEAALAAGDVQRWTELAADWSAMTEREKVLLEDIRARDSRSRFSFPH